MTIEVIMKVQSPLSDPNAMWLAYDEDKVHTQLIDKGRVPQAVQDAVKKGCGRAYFNASIAGKRVTFGEQAAGQTW